MFGRPLIFQNPRLLGHFGLNYFALRCAFQFIGIGLLVGGRIVFVNLIREQRFVLAEDIPAMADRNCTLPKLCVATGAGGYVDIARHHEHIPALLQRLPGGDEGTAFCRCFRHQYAVA